MESSSRRLVGFVLTTAVALSMVFPVGMVSVGQENAVDATFVMIYLENQEQIGLLNIMGIKVIEVYDSFVLAKTIKSQRTALEQAGMIVSGMGERTMIGMDSYRFDTRDGEPLLSPNLKMDRYDPDSNRLYIIQLIGPIKQEWINALEDAGADIYSYLPSYAYIVRMNSNLENSMRNLEFVEWVGIYQPAYKIGSHVSGGTLVVNAWNGPTIDSTMKAIDSLTTVIQMSYDSYFDHHSLKVEADASVIDDIANLPDVIWIEKYDVPRLLDETSSEIVGGIWAADTPYGGPGNYANLQGWDGTGVVVSVTDAGIGDGTIGDAGHIDFENRVIGGAYYGTLTDWEDGHAHGTHVSGIVASNGFDGTGTQYPGTTYYCGMGVAPDAQLFAQKIFSDAGDYEPPANWADFFDDAYNAGVYVHQNSWGEFLGDSQYNQLDSEMDRAVRDTSTTTPGDQPMVICFAAGNNGPGVGTIGSPGSAKNVITVGASENYHPDAGTYGEVGGYSADNPDEVIDFSSRGPEDDTRIKPDVVAPGTAILSTKSPSVPLGNLHGLFTEDTRYEWCSGTSQACPHVSGSSAVIVEWFEAQYGVRPMPAMVKALLINTAIDLGTPDIPNGDEGWGRIYLPTIIAPPVNMMIEDDPQLLQTGEVYNLDIASYSSSTEPLRITLVWTDPAAAALANPTLINNLNLRVTSPSGDIYYGNAFAAGVSVANTASGWDNNANNYDDRNNIECVYIQPAELEVGQYIIEVIAENIGTDAVSGGAIDQDFALVVYNGILDPNLPDLTILPGDLTVTNINPNEGDVITIGTTVTNVGIVDDAIGVEVGWYDGNPIFGGTVINIVPTVPANIPANDGTGYAEITWDTAGLAGYHTIYAVADPNRQIPELTNGNNTRKIDVTIEGYAIDVSCDLDSMAVQAGHSAIYDIVVKNTGTLPDSFSLTIDNPSTWEASLSTYQTAVLDTLATETVQLTVTPICALPGEFESIGVIGVSDNDLFKTDSVYTNTSVLPAILLVNDGNSEIQEYRNALDNNNYAFSDGTPSTDLSPYEIVIWAADGTSPLDPAERIEIENYINAGGHLYINGEDIGWDAFSDGWLIWYGNNLHAEYLADDSGANYVNGDTGDEITDGMSNFAIEGSWPDEIDIAPGDVSADLIFTYGDGSPGVGAGLKADTGTYKLVYIACEYFEGTDVQANKDLLMYRIIEWLNPDMPPVVQVTVPNTQDDIYSGDTLITWTATDEISFAPNPIDIYYSDDDGGSWSPIVLDIANSGSYNWDTTLHADGVNYLVRVVATDIKSQQASDESDYPFSIDNILNDVWYLQVQSSVPGYQDLDMKPVELSPTEVYSEITSAGQYQIGDIGWLSEPLAEECSIEGIWNFRVSGKVTGATSDGNLYAKVYKYDGVTPTLLFTTSNDDEAVGAFMVYHPFVWNCSAPATTVQVGECILVEIWLDATAGSGHTPCPNYATADIPVSGTVGNSYQDTMDQNNVYESITEASGLMNFIIYSEDFESGTLTDWTLGGSSNDWEIGTPTGLGGDPVDAFGGTFCIGNDLTVDGKYGNSIPEDGNYIYTPVIDCTGYTDVTLKFQRWLGVESNNFDHAFIEVSDDEAAWTTVWNNSIASFTDSDWIPVSYDISAVADGQSTVYVRFEIGSTDSSVPYCGWNIDDLILQGNRTTSKLEHKWTIDVPANCNPYIFYLDAYKTNNAEGDDFVFAYSTDNITYIDMVTVTATSDTDTYLSSLMPNTLNGTIYIRVRDTDRSAGNTNVDVIYVDHMYVEFIIPSPRLYLSYDYGSTQSYVEPMLTPASLMTFDIPILSAPGWNFISFPLVISGSPDVVLSDLAGDGTTQWDVIKWYDAQDAAGPWKTYRNGASNNDLLTIDNCVGLWVHITIPGDNLLTVQGATPVTTNIQLYTGWNMVSYPSATPSQADLTLPAQADIVAVYDGGAPYLITDETDLSLVTMTESNAYWVHVTADCLWSVDY